MLTIKTRGIATSPSILLSHIRIVPLAQDFIE